MFLPLLDWKKISTLWNEFRVKRHNPNRGIHQSSTYCTVISKNGWRFLKKRRSFSSFQSSQTYSILLLSSVHFTHYFFRQEFFPIAAGLLNKKYIYICVWGKQEWFLFRKSWRVILNVFRNMRFLGWVNIVWYMYMQVTLSCTIANIYACVYQQKASSSWKWVLCRTFTCLS